MRPRLRDLIRDSRRSGPEGIAVKLKPHNRPGAEDHDGLARSGLPDVVHPEVRGGASGAEDGEPLLRSHGGVCVAIVERIVKQERVSTSEVVAAVDRDPPGQVGDRDLRRAADPQPAAAEGPGPGEVANGAPPAESGNGGPADPQPHESGHRRDG